MKNQGLRVNHVHFEFSHDDAGIYWITSALEDTELHLIAISSTLPCRNGEIHPHEALAWVDCVTPLAPGGRLRSR